MSAVRPGATKTSTAVFEYDSAKHRPTVFGEVRELIRYRDLLGLLVSRTVTTRYKRSVLGVAWTLLNPLINMIVMTVAFSAMMKATVPRYPVYLLIGLVVWNFFSQSTTYSMGTFLWGGSLLKRVYMPPTIFTVACVANCMVNFFFSLVPLTVMMLFLGHPFHAAWWFVPFGVVLLTAFTLGISLFMSALAVFFTDMLDVYQILLQAWFFLTPIIYPPEMLPSQYAWILHLNPMYYMIQLIRDPIFLGQIPAASTIALCTLWSVGALVGGVWYFVQKSDEFAYSL